MAVVPRKTSNGSFELLYDGERIGWIVKTPRGKYGLTISGILWKEGKPGTSKGDKGIPCKTFIQAVSLANKTILQIMNGTLEEDKQDEYRKVIS
jgi:hypothetical protein